MPKKQGFFPHIQYKKRYGKRTQKAKCKKMCFFAAKGQENTRLFRRYQYGKGRLSSFFGIIIISHFFQKIFPIFSQPFEAGFEQFVNISRIACKTEKNAL